MAKPLLLFVLVALLVLPSVSSFAVTAQRSHQSHSSALLLRMADDTYYEPKGSSDTVGTFGDWEELHGNYLLRPSVSQGPPRALLHFLGGAIVGAAPHVSYRYMLEMLATKGYLVVATPYNLSFDHLQTCNAVIERFEKIAPSLARQYGAVPVVGVGHSCGALLQLLITCLFPDTPRAANALLSFNNKPVTEAVPFFEEVRRMIDISMHAHPPRKKREKKKCHEIMYTWTLTTLFFSHINTPSQTAVCPAIYGTVGKEWNVPK